MTSIAPQALALFGGGVRGLYAYYGMWVALNEITPEIVPHIHIYMGSSIGAIMATLFLLSSTKSLNLQDIIYEFSFDAYCQLDLQNLLDYYGLDNGQKFVNLLKDILKRCSFSSQITFQELYQQTGKTLSIVSADLVDQRPRYFNRLTAPNMPIVIAVRASFSIPFLFTPVLINGKFHLDLDESPLDKDLLKALEIPKSQVLSVSMETTDITVKAPRLPCKELEDFQHYSHLIFHYLNKCRHSNKPQPHLKVNTGHYSLVNSFRLSANAKKYLYHLAYQSTAKWIINYNKVQEPREEVSSDGADTSTASSSTLGTR